MIKKTYCLVDCVRESEIKRMIYRKDTRDQIKTQMLFDGIKSYFILMGPIIRKEHGDFELNQEFERVFGQYGFERIPFDTRGDHIFVAYKKNSTKFNKKIKIEKPYSCTLNMKFSRNHRFLTV